MELKDEYLDLLFELADKSLENDEFPVSAIVYDETGILGFGYNRRNKSRKTTDHAEIIAIEDANKKVNNWNLQNKYMVVTLEPCDMCKAVIKESRLSKVYYLIPRYKYKKQYKCTETIELSVEDSRLEKYRQNIKSFFNNKR